MKGRNHWITAGGIRNEIPEYLPMDISQTCRPARDLCKIQQAEGEPTAPYGVD